MKLVAESVKHMKSQMRVSEAYSTIEHFLFALWSLGDIEDATLSEADIRDDWGIVFNMAVTARKVNVVTAASAFLAMKAHRPHRAVKMLQIMKGDFIALIKKLLAYSDLRTNHVGVWLLRGLVDSSEQFKEKAKEAGFFDLSLQIAAKGLAMKKDPRHDNLNEEGEHLRELQRDILENAAASCMLLSEPVPIQPFYLDTLNELISLP